jgi:hypothetical protein
MSKNRTLKPDMRTTERIFITVGNARVGTSKNKFPRLVPVLELHPESAQIINQIMDHRKAILDETKEIAFTVVGYGFSSNLYTLVVALWVHEVPKFFQELNVPTIRVGSSLLLTSATPPRPPTPPPLPISSLSSRKPATRIPEATGNHPSRDMAIGMLYRNCSSAAEKSEQLHNYRKATVAYMRKAKLPLTHGSNISLTDSEKRGSVGVFLRPVGEPSCYLLTAGHVLQEGGSGHPVQCISHFDVLLEVSRILMEDDLTFDKQDRLLKTLFKNNVHHVAHLYHHSIGVSDNLWREDWALARLNDGQGSFNGLWGRLGNAYQDLSIGTVLGFSDETQLDDGIGLSNALPGDTVIKVGATTGVTAGIINANCVYYYTCGTSLPADPLDEDNNYDVATLRLVFAKTGTKETEPFCAPGDSGGGIFKYEGTRLNWIGLLVAIDNEPMDSGKAMGLMVPANVVLEQIYEKTGKKWELV